MDYDLFDLKGTNYCPVDGTISLKTFIDNDNDLNFYSLVQKVKVLRKHVKDNGRRIAVQFELYFHEPGSQKGPSLECIWIFEISEEQKITVIDSYWDVQQFKKDLQENFPSLLPVFFR